MNSMENVIPLRIFKPFPVLLTRHLCGDMNSQDIGISKRVSWFSRLLFAFCITVVRLIDSTVRFIFPEFSITRLITRILGYHFMSRLLMDQTRPLNLPQQLLNDTNEAIESWSDDAKAPGWVNSIEKKFTTKGRWNAPLSQ